MDETEHRELIRLRNWYDEQIDLAFMVRSARDAARQAQAALERGDKAKAMEWLIAIEDSLKEKPINA